METAQELPPGMEPIGQRNPKPYVCIAGGGIGGVALALAFEQRNIPYKVFESDASFDARAQGYGLTLQQGGMAIKKLGLKRKISTLSGWSSRHFIFDKDGNVVLFWGPTWNTAAATVESEASSSNSNKIISAAEAAAAATLTNSTNDSGKDANGAHVDDVRATWTGKHNLHIPRQELRRAVYDSICDTSVFEWNSAVTDLKHLPSGKVQVEVMNRSDNSIKSEAFDCVVGCDGIHSKVREWLIDDQKSYLGVFVMLGIVEASEFQLCKERVFQTSNGSTRLFVMPFDNTSKSMWQLSFPMEQKEAELLGSVSKEEQLQKAISLCSDWHHPIPAMLHATDPLLVTGYPVYDRDPTCSVVSESNSNLPVTLLGDALHCMSPFKGQGANQALLDAIDIAERIEKFCEDPKLSWKRWQKLRGKEKRRIRRKIAKASNMEKNGQDVSVNDQSLSSLTAHDQCVSNHITSDQSNAHETLQVSPSCNDSETVEQQSSKQDDCVVVNNITKDPHPDRETPKVEENSSNGTDSERCILEVNKENPKRKQSKSKKIAIPFKLSGELSDMGPLRYSSLGTLFRKYERDTINRTTPKVLGSRTAVEVLHRPNIIETDCQANRRNFSPEIAERVTMLREANVGALRCDVLDRLAFTSDADVVRGIISKLE